MPSFHSKLSLEKIETKYFFIPHLQTLLMNSCPLQHSPRVITLFLVQGKQAIQSILLDNLQEVKGEVLK